MDDVEHGASQRRHACYKECFPRVGFARLPIYDCWLLAIRLCHPGGPIVGFRPKYLKGDNDHVQVQVEEMEPAEMEEDEEEEDEEDEMEEDEEEEEEEDEEEEEEEEGSRESEEEIDDEGILYPHEE
jgi:hypothetical protein